MSRQAIPQSGSIVDEGASAVGFDASRRRKEVYDCQYCVD